MKELNALVELAKKATPGVWNAFVSTSGDGTFSIHTPEDVRKGDIVNWPGFDTANCAKSQKKANAKFIAAANPETILAIAEAFRALEQRAEAAEAAVDTWRKESAYNLQAKNDAREYIRELEGKLEALEKQQPVAWLVLNSSEGYVERNPDVVAFLEAAGLTKCKPLFARPAPAVSLAELVPEEWSERAYTDEERGYDSGWNDCRAAILRNIEAAK